MDIRAIDPIRKLNEALRSEDKRYLCDILSKKAGQGAAGRKPTFATEGENTWFDFDFPPQQTEKKLQAILEYYNKLPGNKTISIKGSRIYFNNMFLHYVVAAIIKMWDAVNSSLRITEQDDNITKHLAIPITQLRQSAARTILELADMGLTHRALAEAIYKKFIERLDLYKHNPSQIITDEAGGYEIKAYSGSSVSTKIYNPEIIPSDPILSRYFNQLDMLQRWHFLITKINHPQEVRISGFYLILFYLYGHSPFISLQTSPQNLDDISKIIDFLNIPKPNNPIRINQEITSPFQISLLEYLKLSVFGKPTYDNRRYSDRDAVWNIFKNLKVIMIDSNTLRLYFEENEEYRFSFFGRFYSSFEKHIHNLFYNAGIVIQQVDISHLSVDIARDVAEKLKIKGIKDFDPVLSISIGHTASANSSRALPSRQRTVSEQLAIIDAEEDIHQRLMLTFAKALGVTFEDIYDGRIAEDWLLKRIGIRPCLEKEPLFRTVGYLTYFIFNLRLAELEVVVAEYTKMAVPSGFGVDAVTLDASEGSILFNTNFLTALVRQVLIEQQEQQKLMEKQSLLFFSNENTLTKTEEEIIDSLVNIEPVGAGYSKVYEKFAETLEINQRRNSSYSDLKNNKLMANTLAYLAGQGAGGPNARLVRLPGNRCLLDLDDRTVLASEKIASLVAFYTKIAGEPLSGNSPKKSKVVSIVLKRDSKLKSILSSMIKDANFFDNSRDHYLILFNNDFLVDIVSRLMSMYVEINKSISSIAHTDSVPDGMLCPLSLAIMENPVICILDGKFYDETEIKKWLSMKRTSPINRKEMNPDQVVEDVLVRCKWLKDLIKKYLTQHPERDPKNQTNNRFKPF